MTRMYGVALLIFGLVAEQASAQQCNDASTTLTSGGVDFIEIVLREEPPADSYVAYSSGSSVYIRDLTALAWLNPAVALTDDSVGLTGPYRQWDGSARVWVTQSDGSLTRLNPVTATVDFSKYLGRGGGCTDSFATRPAFHRHLTATAAFKANYANDLIFAGTAYCSTNTDNRIYAVDSVTGSTEWTFNVGVNVDMDTVHGMLLDEVNDVLYVTTDRNASASQHSVWAIDVLTGAKLWSVSAGPLWTQPALRGSRLYAADIYGNLRAIDTATGSIVWTLSNGGWPFLTSVGAATVAPNDDFIVAVGINATGTAVWTARDNGATGSWAWDETLPLLDTDSEIPMHVDSESSRVYVGADDGKLYELDLASGTVLGSRVVDAGGSSVDALEAHRPPGTDDLWLVAGSSGGELVKFCASTASVPVLGPAALGVLAMGLFGTAIVSLRRRLRPNS